MLLPRPRIQRMRSGEIRLRLPAREREVLRELPRQLGLLLETGSDELARLFPPAYPDDPAGNAEYDALVRGELLEGKRRALRIVEETIDADRLDEEQLAAWVGALEDLRLVLGTRLGVTEDAYFGSPAPNDPRAPDFALFAYLTWLQEQGVQALAPAQPRDEAER